MSKRNQDNKFLYCVLAALIAFCIIALAYLEWREYLPESQAPNYESSEFAISAERRANATCAGLQDASLATCVIQIEQSERSNYRAEQDLQAQRYMMVWAFFMVVISIFTAGITAVGIFLVYETLKETREAVRAAEEAVGVARVIGEAEVRAYLAIRDVKIRPASANDDLGIEVWFDIKNNGQTPALEVCAFLISLSPTESKSNHCIFQDIAGGETAKHLHITFFPDPNPFTYASEGAQFILPIFMLVVAHKIVLGNRLVFEAAMFSVEKGLSPIKAPEFEMMPNLFNADQIEKIAKRHYDFC